MQDRGRHSLPRFLVGSALLVSYACGDDGVNLRSDLDMRPPVMEAQIRIQVTGGFAGVDYSVGLDGNTGTVLGLGCVAHCGFVAGEVLGELDTSTVGHVFERVERARLDLIDGRDYGTFGADFFHLEFRVVYDSGEDYSVRGTDVLLPEPVQEVATLLLASVGPVTPVILGFGGNPRDWPQDALQIHEAEIAGDLLRVQVEYSGGCREHEIRAVALGGWMESFPVQVNVYVSHHDPDDPCDSVLQEEVGFQLSPLRWDYESSYGTGGKDFRRILVRLQSLSDEVSEPPVTLMYRF
ncbi:MAG: hypothetical protein PVJ76_19075 [Gemmatimonadota bacterium]|jgi:hypothetical protein